MATAFVDSSTTSSKKLSGKPFRIAAHVRIGMGQGTNHLKRMLEYTMVPTAEKLDLDQSPFRTPGFDTPLAIIEERQKKFAILKKQPATHDEVPSNPTLD